MYENTEKAGLSDDNELINEYVCIPQYVLCVQKAPRNYINQTIN